MTCIGTRAVILAAVLASQCSGAVSSTPPSEPPAVHNVTEASCEVWPKVGPECDSGPAPVHNASEDRCQLVSAVLQLVEQFSTRLDLNYISFIVEDLALSRSACRLAARRLLTSRRSTVRISCSHLHSVWQSSQSDPVLGGLTVAVLLPPGRLESVLQGMRIREGLLAISRQGRVASLLEPLPNRHWLHVHLHADNCSADISEVWTFPSDLQPVVEARGNWSTTKGIYLRPKRADGPSSFQGRTVRFATTNASGDVIYDAANNGTLRKIGPWGALMRFLEDKLQLRAQIVLPPGGQSCDRSVSPCGPLDLLGLHQAEVAVGQFRIRPESLGTVDFTTALQHHSYGFVVADPNWQTSAAEVNWRAFSEPFSGRVWACSAAMAVFVWLVWCLTLWAGSDLRSSPTDTAWSVLCITLQQGCELVPRSISARQVVGCFWVFSVILLASYTSNIISLLVSVGRALPFTTLKELAAKRGWVIAVQPDGPAAELLQGTLTDLDNHEIVYKLSLEKSLERILHDEKFTVFAGHTEAESYVRGRCGLTWTPVRLGVTHTHWALQKHLPYGGQISNALNRLVEAGVVTRSQRPWANLHGACPLPTASFQAISLRHTLTAFILLLLGVLASLALLCLERLHWRGTSDLARVTPLPRTSCHHVSLSGLAGHGRPPPAGRAGDPPPLSTGDQRDPGAARLRRQGAVRLAGGRCPPDPARGRHGVTWSDAGQRSGQTGVAGHLSGQTGVATAPPGVQEPVLPDVLLWSDP